MKWTETILDLESSIFNTAWRWIWMENITATLCQWLYRANAGLQQMMQSYRALIHWEYICIIGNVWKIPWIWQVRMALDCDVESSTITSSIQRTQMRWVQISRFKKCCMCQYVRLESIQDWILDSFRSFQDVQVFADFFRVWWNDTEPCWRGLAQALGGHGSPRLVWQLVKATSLSLLTLETMESNGMSV